MRFTTTAFDDAPRLYPASFYRTHWRDVLNEVLAGVTIALGLVGEGLAFSFIIHVPPHVALNATWIVALVMAVLGSRPSLVNGADGVRSAALAGFMLVNPLPVLFYCVILMSVFFFLFALFDLSRFVRMVPTTVMIGFVNGLAIIILLGQLGHFQDHHVQGSPYFPPDTIGWMLLYACLSFALTMGVPRIPHPVAKRLPAPLMGILLCTLLEHAVIRSLTEFSTPTIGSTTPAVPAFPPQPFWMSHTSTNETVPTLTFDLFLNILGPSFTTAGACFLETVLTMEVVDDLTQTRNSRPRQQVYAMALANLIAGLLGTMGGAALIPESVLNIVTLKSNGRFNIGGLVSALTVLLFVAVAWNIVSLMPTGSLVGIMLSVVVNTFDWSSLPLIFVALCLPTKCRSKWSYARFRRIKRFDAIVIVVVTVVTVTTNLFVAVLAGVLLTSAQFVWNTGERVEFVVHREDSRPGEGDNVRRFRVSGTLFFASTKRFLRACAPPPEFRSSRPQTCLSNNTVQSRRRVAIVSFGRQQQSQEVLEPTVALADYSAIHALNVLGTRYAELGAEVIVTGLDDYSIVQLNRAKDLTRSFKVVGVEGGEEEVLQAAGGEERGGEAKGDDGNVTVMVA